LPKNLIRVQRVGTWFRVLSWFSHGIRCFYLNGHGKEKYTPYEIISMSSCHILKRWMTILDVIVLDVLILDVMLLSP